MTHRKGEGTRTSNNLTATQIVALYVWLDKNREYAAIETVARMSHAASQELSFTVTAANITTAKRALKITKPAPVAVEEGCRCKELAMMLADYFASPQISLGELAGAMRKFAGVKPTPATTEPLPFPVGIGA